MLKESIKIFSRVLPFIKPYWKRFLMASVCVVPLALCSAGLAYLVKPAMDEIFDKKNIQMLKLIPEGDFGEWGIRKLQSDFFNTPIFARKINGEEVWELNHDCKYAFLLENIDTILEKFFGHPIEKPQI